jgi:hypothetical protein
MGDSCRGKTLGVIGYADIEQAAARIAYDEKWPK